MVLFLKMRTSLFLPTYFALLAIFFVGCGDDNLGCPAPEARSTYPDQTYGTTEGEIIKNLSFVAADGDLTFQAIREDTSNRLLLISTAAGWCATCREEQPKLQDLFETYGEQGLTVLVSVFEDQNGSPATLEYAQAWANSYELTFPVVADPPFVFSDYYNTESTPMNMIVDLNTMEILFNRTGFDASAVEAIIERSIGGCE